MKIEFKLVINNIQYCPYVTSELFSNKTMCSWYKILEKKLSDFKDKGYNFNHIAEKNFIAKAKKADMSYQLYLKHNMQAVEWKLNAMIRKEKFD